MTFQLIYKDPVLTILNPDGKHLWVPSSVLAYPVNTWFRAIKYKEVTGGIEILTYELHNP